MPIEVETPELDYAKMHDQSRLLCNALQKTLLHHARCDELGPIVMVSAIAELLSTMLSFPDIHSSDLTEKTLAHVRELTGVMHDKEVRDADAV